MNLPTFLPLLLLAFFAGTLAGVVLLSCWLRAIQRRLAVTAAHLADAEAIAAEMRALTSRLKRQP